MTIDSFSARKESMADRYLETLPERADSGLDQSYEVTLDVPKSLPAYAVYLSTGLASSAAELMNSCFVAMYGSCP